MIEDVVQFGRASPLFGIRTRPAAAPSNGAALVLVNSGVVSRVGANRQTVILARALADRGYESLRFDMSGLGDSPVRPDALPWTQSSVIEIAEAIDALAADGRPVVLYGNCGGAAKAFWTSRVDPRVRGLLFTNPPPHPAEEASASAGAAAAADLARDLENVLLRGVRAAFIYAEGDPGQLYFADRLSHRLSDQLASGALQLFEVPRSNHTFATAESREKAVGHLLAWLSREFPHAAI